MKTCQVYLPSARLCNKPTMLLHRGLCADHASYSKKQGHELGFNLIVKNEENCLERTLTNIRSVADEITVTDTGSDDRTVEIALKYADKVLFHLWQDSFSEARNWSLQYSTAKWICWIDADEWFVNAPGYVKEILKRQHSVSTIFCAMESEMPEGRIAKHYLPKIFRNGTAYFEAIVHNQLIHQEPIGLSDITFRHSGYNESDNIMQKKYQRTIRLLRKQLEVDPDDAFAMTNLARSLRCAGEIAEAEAIVDRGLEIEGTDPHIRQQFLFHKMLTLVSEDSADAREVLQEGLSLNPHNLDFLFLLARYEMQQENWVGVIVAMRAYQYEKSQPKTEIHRRFLIQDFSDIGNLENEIIGLAFMNLKRYDEARDEFAIALQSNRYDPELWKNYVSCCQELGDKDAATAATYEVMSLGIGGV